ncbi:MAG: hypothetical protein HQM11_16945 [SAR324 cluster bacterium]|nr:hypothetical protein [SAR324 cluster bacterium]
MKSFLKHSFLLLLVSIVLGGISMVQAQETPAATPVAEAPKPVPPPPKKTAPPKTKDKEKVLINLPPTVDLEQFIKIIATETETVFVYKQNDLKGKMSITSPPNIKVTAADAFFIFEQLLAAQGLTMVRRENSNVVEILEEKNAKYSKLPLITGNVRIDDPQNTFMMRLVQIQFADLQQLKAALAPIFSKSGIIITYEPLDMLLIIDTQINVERVTDIIKYLDVREPEVSKQLVTIYNMKNRQVKDVFNTVSSLFSNMVNNGRREKIKLMMEEQLNAIIILANKNVTEEIIQFIEEVDVRAQGIGATLTVKELKFASASQVGSIVTQIYSNQSQLAKPVPAGDANAGNPPIAIPTKVIPFDNLNALIIIADPLTTKEIDNLIDKLDVSRGDVQVKLHPLKYASANTMASLLSRVFSDRVVAGKGKGEASPDSRVTIIAEPRLNALLLVADSFSVQRILALLEELDISESSGSFQTTFHRLEYASAQDAAAMLKNVFQEESTMNKPASPDQGGSNANAVSNIKIIPEKRLNALLIIADPQSTKRATDLLEKLDVPVGEGSGNFKVYTLKYAIAEDVSKLLKELTGGITDVAGGNKDAAPASGSQKKSEVSISFDKATNSLLVFGPAEIFSTMDRVVEKLDSRRLQVYVEAMIVEVSLSKSLELGVDWNAAAPRTGGASVGGFPDGKPLTATEAISNTGNFTLGTVGGSIKMGGEQFFTFSAFINATQRDSEINVLANPQLLMLNNEEATINVATVVPVGTNSVVDASGNRTTQIEYRDVGVMLTIQPQISGDDSILLQIKETSSNIVARPVEVDQAGVVTLKRELETSVLTGNREIVALGGLINEKVSKTGTKIPGFGDLPLIGWLFRNSEDEVEKTNLLLFIRPYIIHNQEDLLEVTTTVEKRYHKANETKQLHKEVIEEIIPPQRVRKESR